MTAPTSTSPNQSGTGVPYERQSERLNGILWAVYCKCQALAEQLERESGKEEPVRLLAGQLTGDNKEIKGDDSDNGQTYDLA